MDSTFNDEGAGMIELTTNGQLYSLEVDPHAPQLWAISDTIGLTGSLFGCRIS